MATISDRLKEAMRRADVEDAAELARRSGYKDVTVRAWVNGSRRPPLQKCEALGRALNVDGKWIFFGQSRPEVLQLTEANASTPRPLRIENGAVKLIPVYGTAVAGRDGRFDLNGEIIERIPAPPGLGEISGAYAVYVVGDSMEPRYEAGETVFVHPRKPVKRRDYVIIQVIHDGDEGRIDGYIKRLLSISDDTVLCEQLNPPKQIKFPREKVRAIHKIVLGGEG